MNGRIDKIFSFLIGRRKQIIYGFFGVYLFVALLLVIGSISVVERDSNSLFFYRLGVTFGKCAVLVFVVTLIPGIATRFGMKHRVFSLIRIFRRYIGILVYLLVLSHSWLVSIFPRLLTWPNSGTFMLFELFGIAASILLFSLFITSNDWSVVKLKSLWYLLHRLVYIIMWFILFHVGLQRLSFWSFLMGVTVFLMMVSFMADYLRKRQTPMPTS